MAVAEDLYAARRYLESLFFGHLALEKLLKAKIVKAAKKDPLYSHDLVILARYAKIRLASDDLYFLARVNVYNIRARYQDYKKSLFKQADKKFTRSELTGIKSYFYKIR